MRLLEFEAKGLLRESGIAVPRSFIVDGSVPEFLPVVVKAQVPTGGRGKAGGIITAATKAEFKKAIAAISSLTIKGHQPDHLLAEEQLVIAHEYYLSVFVNKPTSTIELMAHTSGGIEVEKNEGGYLQLELTSKNADGVGEQLAEYFNLPDKSFVLQDLVEHLYRCLTKNDALLIEINPLALTESGELVAGDCKITLDAGAKFRHSEWDFHAKEHDTNFVTLNHEGTVATIANGAGLAMATVDAVASAGMTPANFLDIGGGADEDSIMAAFKRILDYPNIKSIVINVFAGITHCDEVAKAIIAAKSEFTHLPPLSVRLSGTNVEAAAELLAGESIAILTSLDECIAQAKRHTA